jgi:hypothetical protein
MLAGAVGVAANAGLVNGRQQAGTGVALGAGSKFGSRHPWTT